MPFYQDIDAKTPAGKRTIERLLALRGQLDAELPGRTLNDTLLLATWNVREFDSPAYGARLNEAIYYMAEIIARFDVVAIQEVRKDLAGLKRVLKVLGNDWKKVFTDVTEGTAGNKERMAFLYDSRKVRFGGLAGELVMPPVKIKGKPAAPAAQLARTPAICGFSSGWCDFMLAAVHILYGKGVASDPARTEEVRQLAQMLRKRTLDPTAWSRNLILLGDFNIFSPRDKTMAALVEAGFEIPQETRSKATNAAGSRPFDQIAFRVRKDRFGTTGKAGVFNYYRTVFREEDEAIYAADMGDAYLRTNQGKARTESGKHTYYKTYWRTYQMSDHLPLWVELKIDYSDEYLERKLAAV